MFKGKQGSNERENSLGAYLRNKSANTGKLVSGACTIFTTPADLPEQAYDLWHDGAVFHFLTQVIDRQRYINTMRQAVRKGGHVILATFAPDGPDHCSGLEVVRYNPESLHNEFGAGFEIVDSTHETHHMPLGTEQKFIYCYCRKG